MAAREVSLAETIAKLDAGDVEEARVVLVWLREKMLAERGEAVQLGWCQECGPHGNKDRVCLLLSWVECETCKPPPEPCVAP